MLRQALLSQMVLEAVSSGVAEVAESDSVFDAQVVAFERWLAGQRETAAIERFDDEARLRSSGTLDLDQSDLMGKKEIGG